MIKTPAWITNIQTPAWGETHCVATNEAVVDATCPIDGTPLISVVEYDFSNYTCSGCDARYKWGDKAPDSLRAQAKLYATRIAKDLADGDLPVKDTPRIQRIVDTARERGLLEERL